MTKVCAILFLFLLCAPATAPCGPPPAPLFDIPLYPPVTQISSLNKDNRFLAVQAMRNSVRPAKVVSIDLDGKVRVLEDLTKTATITVPGERLWIAREGQPPPAPDAEAPETPETSEAPVAAEAREESQELPVTGVQVFLAKGGDTYTVVFQTRGAYYEIRHKDSRGRTLFIAAPRDAYGLRAVHVSADGSRLLVADESVSPTAAGFGQRLYFYAGDGRLLSDNDMGDSPDNWLDASDGLMARDGSYFIAGRGRGAGLVLYDADGRLKWEKKFYKNQRVVEDFSGLIRIRGGNLSLLSFVDTAGTLKVLERAAYGFDFWLSEDARSVYLTVFRQFDVEKSGVLERVAAAFPGAAAVVVDVNRLLPEGYLRPGVEVAPDGRSFIHYSIDPADGPGRTTLTLYDSDRRQLWSGRYEGVDVVPQFVGKGRGFLLRFGYPAGRLIYFP